MKPTAHSPHEIAMTIIKSLRPFRRLALAVGAIYALTLVPAAFARQQVWVAGPLPMCGADAVVAVAHNPAPEQPVSFTVELIDFKTGESNDRRYWKSRTGHLILFATATRVGFGAVPKESSDTDCGEPRSKLMKVTVDDLADVSPDVQFAASYFDGKFLTASDLTQEQPGSQNVDIRPFKGNVSEIFSMEQGREAKVKLMNVGDTPATVTVQVMSAITGVVFAEKTATLAPGQGGDDFAIIVPQDSAETVWTFILIDTYPIARHTSAALIFKVFAQDETVKSSGGQGAFVVVSAQHADQQKRPPVCIFHWGQL